MGQQFQSGVTTAQITSLSAKTTATFQSVTTNGNTACNIPAVPAGKIWRILNVSSSISFSGASTFTMDVQLNGITIYSHVTVSGAANNIESNKGISFDYSACPVLTAGQIVGSPILGAVYRTVSVTYVEESA